MVAPSSEDRSDNGRSVRDSADAGAPGRKSSFEPWLEDFGALGLEAGRWLGVQADRARLHVRRRLTTLVLALPLALAVATAAILAAVHTVRGIASGWNALFAGAPWAAELATGATVFGGMFLAARIASARMDARDLSNLRAKYEDLPPGAPHDADSTTDRRSNP